jgi:hypothetical protein
MPPSLPSSLTILQEPRWDHFPTLASQDNSTLLNGPWGLHPGIKMNDSLWLGFQNIGGLPESSSHPKNDLLRSFVLKNEFDMFRLAETNVNWSRLNASAQFHERTLHTWDKTHASLAYNRTVPSRSPSSLRSLSAFSINTAVSLYSLLRKRRSEFPKVAVILPDWVDGLGRAIRAGPQSLLKS